MINRYGKKKVFLALPLCFKLKTKNQYNMLLGNTLQKINIDFYKWVYKLRLCF